MTSLTSSMCDSIMDWNNLPDVALIELYKYLDDKDRVSTARVCKNWLRLFETPMLWRYRCVSFGGFDAVNMAKYAGRYLKRFGKHLRSLAIRFQGPTYNTVKIIAEATEIYLKQLSYSPNIKLKEFTVFHANMEHCWHFLVSRNRVVSALCRFVRRCRSLQLFNIIAARLTLVDGCRVLESLGRGVAAKSLQNLYMEDMFQSNITPVFHRRYINAITKLKGLSYIYTNYNTVNGEILRAFSKLKSMERLTLTIDTNVSDCLIPAEDWQIFKDACPNTKVSFYIYASGFRHEIRPALPPTVPMKEIDIVAWPAIIDARDEMEQRLSALIHYIANFFCNTLECFTLHLDKNPPVDEEILYFLCRCHRVRDLSLYCRMSVNTVEKICKMQHHGKIKLRTLNIGVLGLDEKEWKHLVQVRTELIRCVSKKNSVVITSEIESEEEEDFDEEDETEEEEDDDFLELDDDDDDDDDDDGDGDDERGEGGENNLGEGNNNLDGNNLEGNFNLQNDGHQIEVDGNNLQNDGHQIEVHGNNLQNDGHQVEVHGNNLQNDGHQIEAHGNNLQNDGHQIEAHGNNLQNVGHQIEVHGNNLQNDGHQIEVHGNNLEENDNNLWENYNNLEGDGNLNFEDDENNPEEDEDNLDEDEDNIDEDEDNSEEDGNISEDDVVYIDENSESSDEDEDGARLIDIFNPE